MDLYRTMLFIIAVEMVAQMCALPCLAGKPIYPGKTWAFSKPAEAGLDEAGLKAFGDYLGGRGCVTRCGVMVYTWGDFRRRGDVASACKPWFSHFLFKALEDGKIPSLDEKIVKYEPRLKDINKDLDHKDCLITWRHVGNQISCYGLVENPGTAYAYNDWQMALFWDCLFKKVYGATFENVDAKVLQPLLTDPLQCEDNPTMMAFGLKDRPGRVGVSPRDFARFGLLYLRKGNWRGKQLISKKHAVMAVTSPLPVSIPRAGKKAAEMIPSQRSIGSRGIPDNQCDHDGGYSWLWWINGTKRNGRRKWPDVPKDAYGAFGHAGGKRAAVVIPSLDVVVSWNDTLLHRKDKNANDALKLLVASVTGPFARPAATAVSGQKTVFPGKTWLEATPESQGVDSRRLNEAMAYLAGKCGKHRTTQAVVIRNGCMIWKGSDIDNRHNVWSCTKSFTGTVLGLLIDDGKCTLETLAKDYVPKLEDRYSGVKLRHFATMTSGYDAVGGNQSRTPFDPAKSLFKPGAKFKYWDSAMNQFANTLTRIAKEPIRDLFKRRIADPVGMTNWKWGDWGTIDGLLVNGGAGNKSKGIHISAGDMARFGLLFLNRGNWNGRQLISASWVDKATSVQVPVTLPADGGGPGVYGFNWWLYRVGPDGKRSCPAAPPRAYRASGHNNNRCVVVPEWNMVIVRLGVDGNTVDANEFNTFLEKISKAITASTVGTPQIGQIIVDPKNPRWLVRCDDKGKHKPFFMCGPGDPEGFLYRGKQRPDGTRDGDQTKLIAKLKPTGANCIYLMAVRSHGGDGDKTQNPFIDNDPAKGLNPKVLDQWELWFAEMDKAGIVIFFFFYDDESRIWNTGDKVGPAEKKFIRGLVKRFKQHKNLIWCVAEEYQERFSAKRISAIAAEIRAADEHAHPIAVHKPTGLDFSEFADDPNIDQFAVQSPGRTAPKLHANMLTAWKKAAGRYNLNMSEVSRHGAGAEARKKNWACAMAGAYVMILRMDIASTPVSDLKDCGRLVKFFESTNFQEMIPRDELAAGDTQYILAKPGEAYIAYSSKRTGAMGIKGTFKGTFSLTWLDCATGKSVTKSGVTVSGVNAVFSPPVGIGAEAAVYIRASDSP